MTHEVLKPFTGPNNRQFKSGEQVDASEWRNTALLVTHRYLKPMTEGATAPIRAPKRGKESTDGN